MPTQPTDVQLREARLGDAEALSALAQETYAAAFGHTMRTEALVAHLELNLSRKRIRAMLREDTFLLAVSGQDLFGFVQFGDVTLDKDLFAAPTLVQPSDAQIRRLYVLASQQNLGLGTQLMAAALGHPRLEGSPTVYLDVWGKNHGAQRFYERYGFKKVGEVPFYLASGERTGYDDILARVR